MGRKLAKLTAVHEVDFVDTTTDFLDVAERLGHVVEVSLGGIGDVLVLPVRETIGEAGIRSVDTPGWQINLGRTKRTRAECHW